MATMNLTSRVSAKFARPDGTKIGGQFRVGIIGAQNSGKTSLINTILGFDDRSWPDIGPFFPLYHAGQALTRTTLNVRTVPFLIAQRFQLVDTPGFRLAAEQMGDFMPQIVDTFEMLANGVKDCTLVDSPTDYMGTGSLQEELNRMKKICEENTCAEDRFDAVILVISLITWQEMRNNSQEVALAYRNFHRMLLQMLARAGYQAVIVCTHFADAVAEQDEAEITRQLTRDLEVDAGEIFFIDNYLKTSVNGPIENLTAPRTPTPPTFGSWISSFFVQRPEPSAPVYTTETTVTDLVIRVVRRAEEYRASRRSRRST